MTSIDFPRLAYEAHKRFQTRQQSIGQYLDSRHARQNNYEPPRPPSQREAYRLHRQYGSHERQNGGWHWDKRCRRWRPFATIYFVEYSSDSVQYPDSPAISEVLDTVHAALHCRGVQILLAATLDDDNVSLKDIPSLLLSRYLQDTLHVLDCDIEIQVETITSYALTTPCLHPHKPIIHINERMVRQLKNLDLRDPVAPLVIVLAVTTILREIVRWVRMAKRLTVMPPQNHVSKSLSKQSGRTVEEAGYVFESLLWGGVITCLSPSLPPALFSPAHIIHGIVIQTGEPWSVEYESESGPSVVEKFVDSKTLRRALQRLVHTNHDLSLPLLKDSEVGPVPADLQGHYRIRGAQTEKDPVPVLYSISRGNTVRGPGRTISC